MAPPKKDELPIVDSSAQSAKIVTGRSPRVLVIVLIITLALIVASAVILVVSIPLINGSGTDRSNKTTDASAQNNGKLDTTTTTSTLKTTILPQTTTNKGEQTGSKWKWKAEDNCRYNPGTWSECNTQGITTRDDTVTSTSDPTCYPERVKNKFCANGETCLYGVSGWGKCTPDGKSWKSITFLKGVSSCEQVHKVQNRLCTFNSEEERQNWKSEKADNCEYNLGTWSECNPRGMATRDDTLKDTSSPHCFSKRVKNKICATGSTCLYGITDWSPCDDGGRSWELMFYLKGPSSCEIDMKNNARPCT